jgi:TRAP-type C4-dicarboxylate transport system substrate-binding protein
MKFRLENSRILACVALALLSGFSTTSALAEDKTIELKLSDWVPGTHPLNKSLDEWAQDVERASNGTIKYKMFPAQQLGKAFDHYDMAKDGIADMAFVAPGYQPGRFPIIDAGDLPLMISNAEGGSAAYNEWYGKYAGKEMKDVKFCFAFTHDPGTFHSRDKKIVVPSDLRGMKIRPAQAAVASLVSRLGGTNVQAAAPEVRDTMDKGLVQAITFPWNSVLLFGIDKATKFHLDLPFYGTGLVWIMNKAVFESMSPAQKKVIDDHCNTEWAVRVAKPWAEFEHSGIAKMKAEGSHEIYSLTDGQLALWKDAMKPSLTEWHANVQKTGVDSNVAMNELIGLLHKYKAGFDDR